MKELAGRVFETGIGRFWCMPVSECPNRLFQGANLVTFCTNLFFEVDVNAMSCNEGDIA